MDDEGETNESSCMKTSLSLAEARSAGERSKKQSEATYKAPPPGIGGFTCWEDAQAMPGEEPFPARLQPARKSAGALSTSASV